MFTITASIVVLLYVASAGFYLAVMISDRKALATPGLATLSLGMLAHTASLVLKLSESGSQALLAIQMSFSILALLLGVGFLAMRKLYGLNSIASFVVPLMMILQVVAVMAEPDAVVVHEWRGPLLTLHIAMSLLGTAAFVLAALTSVFYLIQDHNLRRKKFGPLFNKLPSVDVLDLANVRLVTVGFPVYTLAIALGSFWAWGSTSALQVQYLFAIASWLIYAGIIHARITIGWRGRRAAALTLVGLAGLGAVLSIYLARSTHL